MAQKTRKRIELTPRGERLVRILVSILLAFMLVILALSAFNIASLADIRDDIKSFFLDLAPGKGYPYSVNSDEVAAVTALNGDVYIVMDDKTVSLDSSAKVANSTEHTYANPAVVTNESRALLYNRGENRYRVETRTDTVYSGRTDDDETIITAAIGAKGNIALATLSDKATSRLTVWNSSYSKKVFVWNCAGYTITSVALSDDGEKAAVSVFGSKDGESYSKVVVFDFEYSEPLSETEYPGTAVIGVHFATNNTVAVVGDNKVAFLKGLDENNEVEYGNSTLTAFTFAPEGQTIVVLAKYGSMNSQILYGYSSGGRESFTEEYSESVKTVSASDSRIAVLLNDRVDVYSTGGVQYKSREADANSLSTFLIGKRVYVYQQGAIVKPGKYKS